MRGNWALGLCAAALGLGACGPMQHLMFDRIPPEAQAQVNTAWNNMMTPANRLDRTTLLSVIAQWQLFQVGITRGTFHAEKVLATGTVVMDITYDEANPGNDRFEIRIYDLAWNLARAETFKREEVDAMERELWEMNTYLNEAATQPATQRWVEVPATSTAPAMSEKQLAEWSAHHEAAVKLRQALDAATQPATPASATQH